MLTIMLAAAAGVALLQSPGAPHSQPAAGADRALLAVERVSVDRNAIDRTIEALQLLDANGQDGVVLWVGVIEGRRARVLIAVVLVRDATDSDADVSFVSRDKLVRLNHALSQSGLRLIAEVHSGTTAILDSGLPNRSVVADSDGTLVLIVPTRSPDADPTKWTAYRRFNGELRSVSADQMRKLLGVDLESVR